MDNADKDAWPGRRAGLWLGAVGIAMMIIGFLASAGLMEISRSGQQMTPSALTSLYPFLAQVAGLATMSGTVLLGGGIVLFVAWGPILGGISRRLDRAADRTAEAISEGMAELESGDEAAEDGTSHRSAAETVTFGRDVDERA